MIHRMAKSNGRPPADWAGRAELVLKFLDVPRPRGYIAIVLGWSNTKTAETLQRARARGLVDFTGHGATAKWHRVNP